jgi:uncharacterized membrane protein
MNGHGHLWAIGFDDTDRANVVRDEVAKLGWEKHDLVLLDMAVAVRCRDGTLTLNGEPLAAAIPAPCGALTRLLAALSLGAPPLTCAAVSRMAASLGDAPEKAGIGDDFVREVGLLIKPGTAALFVLDEEGNMDAILDAIRGLGGTVLKTNVDLARAKLIQSTLAAPDDSPPSSGSES